MQNSIYCIDMANMSMYRLASLSPLDGKYFSQTEELRHYFSELALIRYRMFVEVRYVTSFITFTKVIPFKKDEIRRFHRWVQDIDERELKKVKSIENEIHHDVKAVEIFIRKNLKKLALTKLSPWIHWGLTSDDVNNLAYSLMLQHAKDRVLIKAELKVLKKLAEFAESTASVAMPARTHGQLAVPTTVGKEFVVFSSRVLYFLKKMIPFKFGGKLNGAVGNFNAHYQIYPKLNWLKFSRDFVTSLGLDPTKVSTQIEPASKTVYFFDLLRQINNVWLDLARDCWQYIALDYLKQKVVKKDVGSSTMPHKVNPINFENAEGNLELANSILSMFSNKLPISRMQRDLSDSTVKRNFGLGFGYSLQATNSLCIGLEKIDPNTEFLKKEIQDHPELISEALQLILKSWGQKNAYEKIKNKIRGKKTKWDDLIKSLHLGRDKTSLLLKWDPFLYIGVAEKITKQELRTLHNFLKKNYEA